MRTASFRLLTVLAVASLSAACGDSGGGKKDTSDATGDSTPGDTDATDTHTDSTATDSTPTDTDTTTTDTDASDTDTISCGLRECGTFGNLNCGDCSSKPGTECNDNGRCVVPGAPLGAPCGLNDTCSTASPNYPDCLDAQCDSNLCLSNTSGGVYTFAVFRDWTNVFNDSFCTASCSIYKDSDSDGVNDADAQDDCNPADIVDGPVGNAMRCVNFAQPGDSPVGLCMPGTTFKSCTKPQDCTTPGESCELTAVNGALEGHCLANYKSGDWGQAAGIGGQCNDDPAAGDVTYCASGYCEFFGCAPNCGADSDCMTVTAGACQGGHCKDKPGHSCSADADCSSFECGAIQLTDTESFGRCGPKSCTDEDGCGGGFSCQWGWNGSVRHPGPDNSCVIQPEGGKNLGEACDPDPTDNQVVNGGAICKTDLCLGEKCSEVCSTDAQCGAGNACGYYEFSDAMIACDIDADCGTGNACTHTDGACYNATTFQYVRGPDSDGDGNPDDTFVLGLNFCTDLTGATGSCAAQADCAAGQMCNLYEKQNFDGDAVDTDAPVLLVGVCQPSAGTGKLGDDCNDFSDCASGFCLPDSNAGISYCSDPCTDSSQCGDLNVGDPTVHGVCQSYLYGHGTSLTDYETVTYLGLCTAVLGSTADCSDDLTCDAKTEVCVPHVVSGADPTQPGKTEYLCEQAWTDEAAVGTKKLGDECHPAATTVECASGFCEANVDDATTGYCGGACRTDDDCDAAGVSCQKYTPLPRAGEYAVNAPTLGLCEKDQTCATCATNSDCPGGLVCANLGTTAASDGRCIVACATADDCAATQAPGACNDTVDSLGYTGKGCYAKGAGGVPVDFCAAP